MNKRIIYLWVCRVANCHIRAVRLDADELSNGGWSSVSFV